MAGRGLPFRIVCARARPKGLATLALGPRSQRPAQPLATEGDPTVPFIQTAASPAASFSAESGVLDRGGLRPPPVKTLDWRLGGEAAPPQGGKWIFLCHPQLLP